MTNRDAKLREMLDHDKETGVDPDYVTAVTAVLDLHQEHEGRCVHCVQWCDCLDRDEHARVADCPHGNVPWPCPTICVVTDALGVTR